MFFKRGLSNVSNAGLPKTGLLGRKLPTPVVIAAVAAVVAFAGSVFFLQRTFKEETRTVSVPVARIIIPQGAIIIPENIAMQSMPAVQPGYASNAVQVIGKVALTTIYKGEPFRQERLGTEESDKQEVTINTDLARSGLANPGDLVDVYLLRDETTWDYRGELVAQNAFVRSVRDQQGLDVVTGKLPAAVQLMVKPEEVIRIVRGAAAENKAFALVKKYKATEAPLTTGEPPAQDEEMIGTEGTVDGG